MNCPKCGFINSENTEECLKCGIVFKKYQAVDDSGLKKKVLDDPFLKKKTTWSLENHYGERAGEAKRSICYWCIFGAALICLNFDNLRDKYWWGNVERHGAAAILFLVIVVMITITLAGLRLKFLKPKTVKLVDQPITITADGKLKCTRCGSTAIQTMKGGYNVGNGLIGGAVLGPVGLLLGAAKPDDFYNICQHCGNKWKLR